MPLVTGLNNEDGGETTRDGSSAQNGTSQPVRAPAAGALGHSSDRDEVDHTSMRGTVETQGRVTAKHKIARVPDVRPAAVLPDDGETGEELGAFDDSHLQVDQPKNKKKSKKKKPKSKRGLVTDCSLGESPLV